jgi:hypothetical protein
VSRNSPAPRGFRGTSSALRVGQNTFDGRHFTSFARSVQRTELRYPSKGIRSSCEVPFPPTSFSPCGSSDRWQVLRELRVILCQRFSPPPRPKREIKHLCPALGHLSTIFVSVASHTNHLVASFPQNRVVLPRVLVTFRRLFSDVEDSRNELRLCSSLEPAAVRVAPSPSLEL